VFPDVALNPAFAKEQETLEHPNEKACTLDSNHVGYVFQADRMVMRNRRSCVEQSRKESYPNIALEKVD